MPLREQLLQAIETLPSNQLSEALTFIQSLLHYYSIETDESPFSANATRS
jgi:hypothetical protein